MSTVYRIVGIDRNGEIVSYGKTSASSVEIAMLSAGSLRDHRMVARIAVESREVLPGTWTDAAGNAHERYGASVLVAAEPSPGDWTDRD